MKQTDTHQLDERDEVKIGSGQRVGGRLKAVFKGKHKNDDKDFFLRLVPFLAPSAIGESTQTFMIQERWQMWTVRRGICRELIPLNASTDRFLLHVLFPFAFWTEGEYRQS
jgi:hypothetical protein